MRVPSVTAWQVAGWMLRLATAAALAIDAYAHADLVDHYAINQNPGGLSQGDLFHIESGVASLAALLIILSGWRLVWAFVALVAASALAAILISANYDIGSIGPVPDMYEPLWFTEKTMTAWAEAFAIGFAVIGFALASSFRRRPAARQVERREEPVDATATWRG